MYAKDEEMRSTKKIYRLAQFPRVIVAGWPGSSHDRTIFNNSNLKRQFDNGRYAVIEKEEISEDWLEEMERSEEDDLKPGLENNHGANARSIFSLSLISKSSSQSILRYIVTKGDRSLQKFEVAAGRNGWDSALRLIYLGNYLEGAASKWYQTYINDPSKVTSTWETLKTDFRREFVGEDYLRELQRKLFGRKQRFTEPPREYYYDLLELADEVDPNMPFDAFKLHFENGLHPSMQDHFSLAAGAATDLPSLLKAVTILQGIHARKISNGRGNTTSPSPGSYNNTGTSKKQWDTPSARTLNPPWSSEAHASSSASPQSVPRPYQNRSQFPRRNFRDSDSSKRFTNPGNQGASRYNGGNTQHSAGTTRRRDDAYVPNTRSRDGRPICQDCNKIGHFTCRSLPSKTSSSDSPDTNNSALDSPNGGGRLQ
ncbi:hypothetical protein ABEB36_010272 [Hypothenemus hampei]|uniref:Retrotransposon gag domain-containing protein n=1 Tax=Hypothenemus hampei TaxID=57062 RepID=A0ABD1EJ34_HYPHA